MPNNQTRARSRSAKTTAFHKSICLIMRIPSFKNARRRLKIDDRLLFDPNRSSSQRSRSTNRFRRDSYRLAGSRRSFKYPIDRFRSKAWCEHAPFSRRIQLSVSASRLSASWATSSGSPGAVYRGAIHPSQACGGASRSINLEQLRVQSCFDDK